MTSTRREFLHYLGLALASAFFSGCLPERGEEAVVPTVAVPTRSTPAPAVDHARRRLLRQYWLRIKDGYPSVWSWSGQDTGTPVMPEPTLSCGSADRCVAEHDAILAEMVRDGELTQAVANKLRAAFHAAADDIFWPPPTVTPSPTPDPLTPTVPPTEAVITTCYMRVAPLNYTAARTNELLEQLRLLSDLAASGTLNQETVDQAYAAIAREIGFLCLSEEEQEAISMAKYVTPVFGSSPTQVPGPDDWMTPEAAEAARFLVELFLEP